jgi:hypothetical protein
VVCYGVDAAHTAAMAVQLSEQIQSEREAMVFHPQPPECSLQEVEQRLVGCISYVVLLDHADNVMSGGDASSSLALQLLLNKEMSFAPFLAGPFCDAAFAASVADNANEAQWRPRDGEEKHFSVTGRVKTVSKSGSYVVTGFALFGLVVVVVVWFLTVFSLFCGSPIYRGSRQEMGRCVVLELGSGSVVVVSSRPVEPFDEAVFTSLDIDYKKYKLLLLKSRMYCRPGCYIVFFSRFFEIFVLQFLCERTILLCSLIVAASLLRIIRGFLFTD